MKAGVILVLIFSVGLLSGCANLKKSTTLEKSNFLEPATTLKFNDIPIPSGFKLVPENSYSFESSGVRVGVLRYNGKANPDQVVNFYKEQMPLYNWNLLNIVEYGKRLMNFDRENETCIIDLSGKGNKVIVTVSLGPKSQNFKKGQKTTLK